LDLDIRFPKELGGSGDATNPEQLFAAAWSACFGTSVTIAAVKQNIKIAEVSVTAKIGVLHDNGDYSIDAHLLIKINEVSTEIANELVKATQSICSYSKATKGNITTAYEVVSN